jgi:hypothetical protein
MYMEQWWNDEQQGGIQRKPMRIHEDKGKGKGKAIPVTGRGGP